MYRFNILLFYCARFFYVFNTKKTFILLLSILAFKNGCIIVAMAIVRRWLLPKNIFFNVLCTIFSLVLLKFVNLFK